MKTATIFDNFVVDDDFTAADATFASAALRIAL
jgi:hypothetical protein